MNAWQPIRAVAWLVGRPNLILALHLLLLHVLVFGGWRNMAVRLLWLVALGLFLLWQPFVTGERRISPGQGAGVFGLALLSTLFLGPWLLLVWCGALVAVVGGRVLWTGQRQERVGYLLTFAYLACLVVFGVLPEISPAVVLDPIPRDLFGHLMLVLLPVLFFLPAQPLRRRAGDAFDLFYGVLVFLVLAVLVLGALAYMLVGAVSYVESLFKTTLTVALTLLLVAWAWNPRAGFSGIGSTISRYLLSVGMPLEHWLLLLAEESDRESQPERFLAAVVGHLENVPWVIGGEWLAVERGGSFGQPSRFAHEHRGGGVRLKVYFRHHPSPAMRWHIEWLLRLVAEFYLVKRQAHDLRQIAYQQAVYETGARVTHDVKNLLQSLLTLCYAAKQPGDPVALAGLVGRQLPQIAERLKSTLAKLQAPCRDEEAWLEATAWWAAMRERYAEAGVFWSGQASPDSAELPAGLFDSVLENLLQNAFNKRQREPDLLISVSFTGNSLRVADNGSALPASLVDCLFREPVMSEDGLGIGLYHAARQADALGYALVLEENRAGAVCFSLSARP